MPSCPLVAVLFFLFGESKERDELRAEQLGADVPDGLRTLDVNFLALEDDWRDGLALLFFVWP